VLEHPLAARRQHHSARAALEQLDAKLPGCGSHTTTLLGDGRVLVLGPCILDAAGPSPASIFDPASGWRAIAGAPAVPDLHTAVLLDDGRVLVAGGAAEDGRPLADAYLFDPARDALEPAAPLATARSGHAMVALNAGGALVIGGATWMHVGDGTATGTYKSLDIASVESFDPTLHIWSAAPPLSSPRSRHTATRLASGRTLVVGGTANPFERLTPVELRDPVDGSWSIVSAFRAFDHATFELADATILVIGQPNDGRSNQSITSWNTKFYYQCTAPIAVALADGRILVAAGWTPYHVMPHDCAAQIYDPTSDTWAAADVPDGLEATGGPPRQRGTATLLRDGRVLIIADRTVIIDPRR
jgi:hypothetical protein